MPSMTCSSKSRTCKLVVSGYHHMRVPTAELLPGDFRMLMRTDLQGESDPRDPEYRQTFLSIEPNGRFVTIAFGYPESYAGQESDHIVEWKQVGTNHEHIWRPLSSITVTIEEDLLEFAQAQGGQPCLTAKSGAVATL